MEQALSALRVPDAPGPGLRKLVQPGALPWAPACGPSAKWKRRLRFCAAGWTRRRGEAAAVRYFLNHVDEVSRPAMRRDRLAEVRHELAIRGVSNRPPAA